MPGPVDGIPLFGYVAIALLLVGTLALMPRLASWAFGVLPRPRGAGAQLALAQLQGAPGQAAVSLAAIVASFSLMVAMAIMVASFRVSLDSWLDRVLPADLYLRTGLARRDRFLAPTRGSAHRARCRGCVGPNSCAYRNCCCKRRGRP